MRPFGPGRQQEGSVKFHVSERTFREIAHDLPDSPTFGDIRRALIKNERILKQRDNRRYGY